MMSLSFMIEKILAVDLDFGSRPLAEEDAVPLLHIDGRSACPLHREHPGRRRRPSFLWFLLGGVGDNDAALGLLFAFKAFDYDAVVKRTEFHVTNSLVGRREQVSRHAASSNYASF